MYGIVTTSCLLFLLSACAHAAESNLRGGSRSLAPEPELFGFVGEVNPLTTVPTFTTTFPTLSNQFPTGGVVTTTFPSIPAVPSTFPFQFPTNVAGSTRPDPKILFQFGSPKFDSGPKFDYGNSIGGLGLGLGGPLVGGRSCPKVPGGTPCTLNYLPLSCDGCVYDNSCLAKAAGYSEWECEPVPF